MQKPKLLFFYMKPLQIQSKFKTWKFYKIKVIKLAKKS